MVSSSFRLRAKRTLGTEPPADMLFGELAYSDGDQQLYIGRPTGPPATFISDLTPLTDDIEALGTTATDQALELAALATTDTARAVELAALATSDTAQDSAIAALILNDSTQDTEIGSLTTNDTAQDAAIATFETTAQLNARDTANRSRANHTGTQAAATVTGLAAVATSGAYTDLSGKPTVPYGFTYDQQAEPVSPATGATWRERSAGGLIVGDWEWNSTPALWLSVQEFRQFFNPNFGALSSVQTFSVGLVQDSASSRYYIKKIRAFYRQSAVPLNATNFYTMTISATTMEGVNGATTYGTFLVDTPSINQYIEINLNTLLLATYSNGPVAGITIRSTVTGSPGGVRFGYVTYYRFVR